VLHAAQGTGGHRLHKKTKLRVQAVSTTRDGQGCVLVCHDDPKLRIWDVVSDTEVWYESARQFSPCASSCVLIANHLAEHSLQESEPLTSLALSSDGRHVLVSAQRSLRNSSPVWMDGLARVAYAEVLLDWLGRSYPRSRPCAN
jgi:hypothetical protein